MLTNAGAPDPSFGGIGFVAVPTPYVYHTLAVQTATATQPDGKVLLGGYYQANGSGFLAYRLNSDGALDTSFGQGGMATVAAPDGFGLGTGPIAVQPDGKILLTGVEAATAAGGSGPESFVALRLKADGTVDTSYGAGGVASGPIATAAGPVTQLRIGGAALQADGSLVVAGPAQAPDSSTIDFAVARFDATGKLDTAFGTGGTALIPEGIQTTSGTDAVAGVAVQAGGRIVVAGSAVTGTYSGLGGFASYYSEGVVLGLTPSGAVDPSFGGPSAAGTITYPPDPANPSQLGISRIDGLALDGSGRVVLSGDTRVALPPTGSGGPQLFAPRQDTLIRLAADGTPDPSFGTGGVAVVATTAGVTLQGPLVVQADGKIVEAAHLVVGTSPVAPANLAAVRFLADGGLDPSFGATGTPGVADASPGRSFSDHPTIALASDGSIVEGESLMTFSQTAAVPTFAAARLLAVAEVEPTPSLAPDGQPGALDPSFDRGQGSDSLKGLEGYATRVVVQPDGKILVASRAKEGQSDPNRLDRFNADGTLDTTFGTGTGRLPVFPNAISDLIVQPDGRILILGGPTAGLNRLDANALVDPTFAAGTPLPAGFIVDAVALQADGKIILAGSAPDASSPDLSPTEDFAAVRLNADGTLNTRFGNGGEALVGFAAEGLGPAGVTALAITPDGRITLLGQAEIGQIPEPFPFGPAAVTAFAAARLNADGTLDTTFGGSGTGKLVLINDPSGAKGGLFLPDASAVQPDGSIVLGAAVVINQGDPGVAGLHLLAARLEPNGTVDPSFGTNDRVDLFVSPLAILGTSPSQPNSALAIGPDGKIVLSTTPLLFQNTPFTEDLVARLNPDGGLDPTFGGPGTPGLVAAPIGGAYSVVNGLAIQPDGNILLAGGVADGTGNQGTVPQVVRLLGQATTTGSTPTPVLKQPPADFDGSGRSDLAVYIPAAGAFAYRPASGPDVIVPFGIPGAGQTIPAPGDYTGAGLTEIAAYLPSLGDYAIRPASGPDLIIPFGIPGAGNTIPTPGDFQKTGRDNLAAYLPAFGSFAIRPVGAGPDVYVPFGIPGAGRSIPAVGDYFGTGVSDLAVYLPSLGAFAIRPPSGPDLIIPFGIPGAGRSIPVPGDYDGSGRTELAVYFPALGIFAYRPANGGPDVIEAFGSVGDGSLPVPGDYTGSGRTELAVYDPNYGTFAYRPASGPDVIVAFGAAGPFGSIPATAPAPALAIAPSSTVQAQAVVTPGSAAATSRTASIPSGPVAAFAARRASKVVVPQADPSKPGA